MTRPGGSGPALRLAVAALVAAVAIGALAAVATPVGAHSDDGTMGIEVSAGPAPLTARVRVLLEYANDREVAPGATVVAEAVGPGAATVAAVPLADLGRGSYEAVLTVPSPGTWTVTVTATGPAATATAEVAVSESVGAPTAPTTPPTSASGDSDVRTSSDRVRAERDRTTDDGTSPALIAAIAAVLLAAGAGAVIFVRRR